MNNIKKNLDDEILRQLERLNELDADSDEYESVVSELAKLHGLRMNELKMSHEDAALAAQSKEQMKDRIIRIGLTAAEITVPLIFYGIWMNKGFKFEETGTFTSSTFRGLFGRFKPTK